MESFSIVCIGAVVGLVMGLTGVGSGSLLTPTLILYARLNPAVAVGSSVVVSFGTKIFGSWSFHRRGMVNSGILREVCLAAVPGAIVGGLLLRYLGVHRPDELQYVLVRAIGGALILVSIGMLVRIFPSRRRPEGRLVLSPGLRRFLVLGGSFCVGLVFALTSVGSGAALIPLLTFCYATTEPGEVVGTAITVSTLLSAIAGFTHATVHTVDWRTVGALLAGSVPAIWLSSHIHARIPRQLPQGMIAAALMVIGAHMLWQ